MLEKYHECAPCGAQFHAVSGLTRHVGATFPYWGDDFEMLPLQSGILKTHKHTHTSEKSFKCDICGSCFSLNGHLKSRMRIHTGEKPFKCDWRGLWFLTIAI